MKKLLLFVAGLMLAMSASAGLYFRGGNNGWGAPAEFEFTDNGDGTFTLTKSFALTESFKLGDESTNWTVYNFGSAGEEAKIGTINLAQNGGNINVSSTINVEEMIFDMNALTLTIKGNEGGAIEINSWTIAGDKALVGVDWTPDAASNLMTEGDGVYTLTIKGVTLEAAYNADTENPGYGYKACANGSWSISVPDGQGNQYLVVDADGIYDVTFTLYADQRSLEAVATPSTSTGIEDIAADDEVVAAFDITGKPVAADAKGIVILQYKSGKAAKVINY
jgi:hypothetical protein